MKYIKRILASINSMLFLFIIIFSSACNETLIPEEHELEKYPYMHPFILEKSAFRGIQHDLDSGQYSFAIKSNLQKKNYFEKIKENALKNEWLQSPQIKNEKISFYKKLKLYEADNGYTEIEITHLNETNEFEIKITDGLPQGVFIDEIKN